MTRLLDRSIIGVADERFIDAVRDHLAEGGLFAGTVSLPEVEDAVPLPRGIAIYKQIGHRLQWTWATCRWVSRWCGLTCTSSMTEEPRFLRIGYSSTQGSYTPHCVSRQMRMIGKWYSSWWNEHSKGYAILCRVAEPDELSSFARDIMPATAPEVQMWCRDVLFNEDWKEGMTSLR